MTRLWTDGGPGNWVQLAGWGRPAQRSAGLGCTYKLRRWVGGGFT